MRSGGADRRRSHALGLLVICFLVSGGLRLFASGTALAEQRTEAAGVEVASVENCAPTENPDTLLVAVQERSGQLDALENRIAERQAVLAIAETEFEARLSQLVVAEEKLAATLAIADNAAENDLLRLTAVYENMKPKNAAGLFDTMDSNFAAGFLIRMAPKAAADILSSMDQEAAYSATVLMAARNVGAPTE